MSKKIEEEPFDEETEDSPEVITNEDETTSENEYSDEEKRLLKRSVKSFAKKR